MRGQARRVGYPSRAAAPSAVAGHFQGRISIPAVACVVIVAIAVPCWFVLGPPAPADGVEENSHVVSIPVVTDDSMVPEAARKVIDRAISQCRSSPTSQSFAMLGRVYHGNGLTRVAAECYQKSIDFGADDALSPYLLGTILLEEGQIDSAAAAFRRSILHDATYPLTHFHLGRSLLQIGDYQAAEVAFAEAVVLDASDPILLAGLARAKRLMGHLEEAEVVLRRALMLDPDNPEAHQLLGLVLHAMDRTDEAEIHLAHLRSYNATVYNDPWMWEAYRHAASVHVRLDWVRNLLRFGRINSARALAAELAAQHPDQPAALMTYADVLYHVGEDERAVNLYARAAELDPSNARVHLSMAQIFLKYDMLDKAGEYVGLALAIDPNQIDGLALQGIIALRSERFNAAREYLERVLETKPTDLRVAAYLAEVLIALELHADAIEVIKRTMAARGGTSIPYADYQFAVALMHVGRLEEAERILQRALVGDPDNEHIERQLELVVGMRVP